MAYKKDTDYQELINQAVKAGDYKTAAQYEQQRNEKILGEGLNYGTTNKYQGWLDNNDYGTIGQNQMAAGAPWEDVLNTYENRYNKAANTEGLTQYANDEIQKEMWDYITANMNKPTAPTFGFSTSRPTYDSDYTARINAQLDKILNREDFSYNAEDDILFQQYQNQYQREGQRSMQDTLAAAAANAGGMNSYAVTAAQQASDYYASQLGDKIPELYQMAYQMYLNDKASEVEDLGLLQAMDESQYSRYRDTMNDWRNDRDFAYNAYRDDVGDYQWGTEFDYGVGQDAWEREQYKSETANAQALEKAQMLAAAGDFSGYKALGYTDEEIATLQAAYERELASGTGSGSFEEDEPYVSVYQQMFDLGLRSDADAYAWLQSQGYKDEEIENLMQHYKGWIAQENRKYDTAPEWIGDYGRQMYDAIKNGNITYNVLYQSLTQARANGEISDKAMNWLLSQFGV